MKKRRTLYLLLPLLSAALAAVSCGPQEVPVTGITISERSLSLLTGESAQLSAEVLPEKATDKTVNWESANTAVATVSDGTVTALSAGMATITAKAGEFTASCLVTVSDPVVPVSGVSLSEKEVTIIVNNPYNGLKASVAPDNATDKSIRWTSSDESVLAVKDNGDGSVTLTGLLEADAFVTVTTADGGLSDICTVYVRDIHAESVSIKESDCTIDTGSSVQLHAEVQPADAVNLAVVWDSSAPEVASVDANGLVKGLKSGSAKISVTTVDGGLSASVTVTVKDIEVSSVSISPSDVNELAVGKSLVLSASVSPANATDKSISWSSSDPAVASVDASGTVKGLKEGTVTIRATASNGVHASLELKVIVPTTNVGGGDFDDDNYGKYE